MNFTIDGIQYRVEEQFADAGLDTRYLIFNPSYLCTLMMDINGYGVPYWRAMDANVDKDLVYKLGSAIEAITG